MATENRLRRRITRVWSGLAVQTEASRGGVEIGCADMHLSLEGWGAWVELKVWPTPLSAEQLSWHLRGRARGATCLVVCQVGRSEFWVGTGEEYVELEERPSGVDLPELIEQLTVIMKRSE